MQNQVVQPQPEKVDGPLTSDQILPTLVMLAVALLGGLANFVAKVKRGHARAFNVTELIGELFVSGVAGIFAYWVFKGLGVNEYLTAAGVGIIGHMGSRAIFLAEQIIGARMEKLKGQEWSPKEKR